MKQLTTYIANLKISPKIWLCMLTIALVLSFFIGTFNSLYFVKLYREDTYSQTADSMQIGKQSLEDSYKLLLTNTISLASTAHFHSLVSDAHTANFQNYGAHKALLQDPLSSLTVSHPLLDSIIVIGKNKEFYSLFTNTLKKESSPETVFDWDLSEVNGITWLPVRQSPFIKSNDIVPVIIPISLGNRSQYLSVSAQADDADVLIVLMLDSKRIADRLALSSSSYVKRTLYVANTRGENISLTANSPYYALAASPDTRMQAARPGEENKLQLLYDCSEYSLYSEPLGFCGLNLVGILPKTLLHQKIVRMNTFILLIAFAGLIIATVLALLLSRFVTKPFKQLIANVNSIEQDTYTTPCQMKYQDEVGHLNMAINSMYATIEQQIEKIKQSERAKYRSEIQLLSEQINPHFLYNTLECINMEVLGGHRESASSMITSLGDFLRIGLSYGSEMIPIEKELTHVKAYIDIMNHRFNRKIDFRYSIDENLQHLYVLKSILQPLAENSIRHGFDVDVSCYENILMPAIEVHVLSAGGHVVLELSDNGLGIDVEKATSALQNDFSGSEKKQHVGLHNIYQRLNACYGAVSITFETIPYFKNTVRITLQ